ncbi:uncharacterized protein ALTATR162_LOCUS4090 [Alternaria atra]|uniref:GmrSD restriction endonucleases N-terminal domain-containing protein n=1 Tax=Alternaria atra TaxID=119953 RepID=A0A8J2MYX2_9PLEO|nr:uncharacterized protein ALTATR162_LOCUS4090 [Alternaria atra]CAG5156292.1 unnamed protein product [Alternaria atra]
MEVDNINNNNTHRGSATQPHGNNSALPSAIKDEADNGDTFAGGDSDSDPEIGYKPRPQLPQPNVNMRSLANLIKELVSGVIDVDPEYQREVVWTVERMTETPQLAKFCIENYYIPPIILNKKQNAGMDSSISCDTLVCVDGKQRLASIRAFVKGKIPCHDHKGEKWWFCKAPGTNHKRVLSLESQKMFLEKDFVAFQFTELSPEQEEDLFARVQMGVQLTVAEKMRAKQGPWQELAKLFVEDFPAIYNLMKDRARAKDFQLTLACFSQIVEVKHPTTANGVPILKTNYSALPKLLSNTGVVDDAIKSHLASVWTTFKELIERDSDIFTNADKHLSGVQTFAPVEMVAVTVLISMYSETSNNELLIRDIKALREALREHFKDLRLHTTVWKFVWDFIENLEAIRGAVDGTTITSIDMGKSFDPARDIGSLEGKVILVTGGNAGLGKQTIAYLAAHNPKRIYLTARTESKARDAITDIKNSVPNACEIVHLPLDLTSFSSIADAASSFKSQESRLDILINNAGIMASPYSTTKEGYEIQFGTNHMGHALLTKLLIPTMLDTAKQPGADVRIVNLSSMGERLAVSNGIEFDQQALEKENTWRRYGASKLANILFARSLALEYPTITSVSLHPGVILTDLFNNLRSNIFLKVGLWIYGLVGMILPGHYQGPEGGALNTTWCATTAKDHLENGAFYMPVGKKGSGSGYARDEGLRKKLWEWTEEELKKHGY